MGHEIVGVEYSEEPIKQFFDQHKIDYSVKEAENFKLYVVCIFCQFILRNHCFNIPFLEQRSKNKNLQWRFFQIHQVI